MIGSNHPIIHSLIEHWLSTRCGPGSELRPENSADTSSWPFPFRRSQSSGTNDQSCAPRSPWLFFARLHKGPEKSPRGRKWTSCSPGEHGSQPTEEGCQSPCPGGVPDPHPAGLKLVSQELSLACPGPLEKEGEGTVVFWLQNRYPFVLHRGFWEYARKVRARSSKACRELEDKVTEQIERSPNLKQSGVYFKGSGKPLTSFK